jgi:hypothetical protein
MNYILTICLGCFIGAVIGCYFATINKRFDVLRNAINQMNIDVNDLQFEMKNIEKLLDSSCGGDSVD